MKTYDFAESDDVEESGSSSRIRIFIHIFISEKRQSLTRGISELR